MGASDSGPYYDPYDFEIDVDPYPVWKRLRDEAMERGKATGDRVAEQVSEAMHRDGTGGAA